MLVAILHFTTAFAAVIAALSIVYCLLCAVLGLEFARSSNAAKPSSDGLPPISVLKPVKGADPEMYEALKSHCLQDYPDYEVLVGITDPNDPAIAIIERLKRDFPNRDIRLVHCEKRLGANGKVSTLAHMVPLARNGVLIVNDSDIRVGPDYLRTVSAELQQPGVGLVTCLYRGTPEKTLWSKLEALGISMDFVPEVLVARLIECDLHFGLGSTLALRKSDLLAIGGFESLLDYLADDYELGRRIAEKGLRVMLSTEVVETHLPAYDLPGFISHQLRWARTIRASRPLGYAGLLFTFTLPWALAAGALSGGALWGLELFAAAVFARFMMAFVSARLVLRDSHSPRYMWALPLRDFVAVLIWLAGLVGRRIIWRGEVFELSGGKLKRVARQNQA